LLDVLSVKSAAASDLRNRYKTTDIEIALTRLDVDIADSQDPNLRALRKDIEGELANYLVSFRASEDVVARSRWLTCLIDNGFSSGDTAISLNYDCVLEGALDCRGKWSPNGGYGSSFNGTWMCDVQPSKSPVTVLKIHGSTSFVIAPDPSKPKVSTVAFIFDESLFPCSAKNNHIGYGLGTGRSYVIAPSYVKIPSVEISYLMLDALTATMRAQKLVIVGTALRPEDQFLTVLITNFLHQPSCRSRKVIIVDPVAVSIRDQLRDYWGVNVSNQIVAIQGKLQDSVGDLLAALAA
jgi:hypothetical protein